MQQNNRLDAQKIEQLARLLAREFMHMEGAALNETDLEEDFQRYQPIYLRMARVALNFIATQDIFSCK